MPRSDNWPLQIVVVVAAAALVTAVFAPGLGAGFLLDDFENFAPLKRFLAGDLSWLDTALANRSGPLHRPVSMLSFVIDARLWGMDPHAFLRTSLALHLACAALAGLLIVRLLRREPAIAHAQAAWVAGATALLWAVLPIHVSVVSYSVQRMAILSALFVLAALLAYASGRERLATQRPGVAVRLYVLFPLFTLLAAFSKENGVLAPLIAAAIELAYFGRTASANELRGRRWFFAIFLVLPALAAGALLLSRPALFLAGYDERPFTLVERLLSQPRILWDYVQQVLAPFGPSMGLIHDDFPKSTSLWNPWTTAPAIGAWLVLVAFAARARRAAPGILGGVLFFLAAHAMESTLLPLELYFEHRNYLAALGLLLALASAAAAALSKLPTPSAAFGRTAPWLLLLVPLTYAGVTLARSSVWGLPEARAAQALENNPYSPRLRSQLAIAAAEHGDLEGALAHIDMAAHGVAAPPRRTLHLWRLTVACVANKPLADDTAVSEAIAAPDLRIQLSEMVAFEAIADRLESGACQWPGADAMLRLGRSMLAASTQAPSVQNVWRTRYVVARLAALSGDLQGAVMMAEQAWRESAWNSGVGVLVFQLNASRADIAACRRVLDQLKATVGKGDRRAWAAIATFEDFVHNSESGTARPQPDVAPAATGPAGALPRATHGESP